MDKVERTQSSGGESPQQESRMDEKFSLQRVETQLKGIYVILTCSYLKLTLEK